MDFLGRTTSAPDLVQAGRALAAGLVEVVPGGLGHGDRVAVLLPNSPTQIELLIAADCLGLRLLVLDPREEEAELATRLAERPPTLLVTSNPTPLFDKVLRLLRACPADMPVAVDRLTDLLPFPRNLIAPLLRGGGLATLPPDPRFLRYAFLKKRQPFEGEPRGMTALEGLVMEWDAACLQTEIAAAAAPQRPDERWLLTAPLADARSFAAVLRGLEAGARVLLSPRLDRKSLTKIGQQAGSDREVP
ncbi:AMP-binding protein [Aquibaculum arenosum]|uniref:AMP-binding protein n=1 Tax=Aquibaculum arenosum TaxID=3032591 RepID=A0ABT5YPT7_9PROT|nr:AMP-binding protein [Fodinicurvata sp. CAU 1616]MDF2096843.1 AMP-binding protein [Fodinicurvata sp. CAU 1616]